MSLHPRSRWRTHSLVLLLCDLIYLTQQMMQTSFLMRSRLSRRHLRPVPSSPAHISSIPSYSTMPICLLRRPPLICLPQSLSMFPWPYVPTLGNPFTLRRLPCLPPHRRHFSPLPPSHTRIALAMAASQSSTKTNQTPTPRHCSVSMTGS